MSGARIDGRLRVLARSGRAGLAWEILRRDPAYGAAVETGAGRSASDTAPAAFTTRWGLHFR